jgi:hypothetical protein
MALLGRDLLFQGTGMAVGHASPVVCAGGARPAGVARRRGAGPSGRAQCR